MDVWLQLLAQLARAARRIGRKQWMTDATVWSFDGVKAKNGRMGLEKEFAGWGFSCAIYIGFG
jgi:hypothetical protein